MNVGFHDGRTAFLFSQVPTNETTQLFVICSLEGDSVVLWQRERTCMIQNEKEFNLLSTLCSICILFSHESIYSIPG